MQTQTSWKFDWKANANAAVDTEDVWQALDSLIAEGQMTWLLANDSNQQREQMKYCRALYKHLIDVISDNCSNIDAKLGMSLFNSQELGGRAVTITATDIYNEEAWNKADYN